MSTILCFFVFYKSNDDHRDLPVLTHAFPTRRSSELAAALGCRLRLGQRYRAAVGELDPCLVVAPGHGDRAGVGAGVGHRRAGCCGGRRRRIRSEEHTSELQSLMSISYAVFCLKTNNSNQTIEYHTYTTYHYTI